MGPGFRLEMGNPTRCLVFPLERSTGRFLRPLGRALPVEMKQVPPAASAGYSGSVGLDALQIEHLAVTPQVVRLRDFRALKAIALADSQAVQLGAGRRNPAGFHSVDGEQFPFAGAAVHLLHLSGYCNHLAEFQRASELRRWARPWSWSVVIGLYLLSTVIFPTGFLLAAAATGAAARPALLLILEYFRW